MIETTASRSFAKNRGGTLTCSDGAVSSFERADRSESTHASPERGDYSVFTWLNLVCLDAPIVAVSWQWLFARSFGISETLAATSALFLTAWLIYLADRFGDSLSLDRDAPASLRQRFCRRHRTSWAVATALVLAADLFVVINGLNVPTLWMGGAIGIVALLYLILNQLRPSLWRAAPVKELVIGFLFASGAMIPLAHGLTSAIPLPWMLFACLCSLNCISIAVWERDLDVAQERVSIATVFPKIVGWLLPLLAAVGLGSLVSAEFVAGGRVINLCVGLSAILLGAVHFFRARIERNTRTALADLVLCTPLIILAAL